VLTGDKPQTNGFYRELLTGATKLHNGRKPDSVCFVWMQGESDAMAKSKADVYEHAVRSLISLASK
jgi:hypothetical protein